MKTLIPSYPQVCFRMYDHNICWSLTHCFPFEAEVSIYSKGVTSRAVSSPFTGILTDQWNSLMKSLLVLPMILAWQIKLERVALDWFIMQSLEERLAAWCNYNISEFELLLWMDPLWLWGDAHQSNRVRIFCLSHFIGFIFFSIAWLLGSIMIIRTKLWGINFYYLE